eukprot:TRINITY_DN6303_c0_g1_i1.p1 TRINITY_DN6303_c0_g1~~TRINITY_DN6303_c0_g1_i1.p1  ORF type:complete len:450 (-),score=27.01 TRINITY_DN6303_c0_g1_i1:125-1474(-)
MLISLILFQTKVCTQTSQPISAKNVIVKNNYAWINTNDNCIIAWNIHDPNMYVKYSGHTKWITTFLIKSRRIYTCSADATCRVWTVTDAKEKKKKKKNAPKPAFDTASLVDYSKPRYVEGKFLFSLEGHTDTVTCVCFVEDCNLVCTGSADNTIRCWTDHGKKPVCVHVLEGHDDWVYALVEHNDTLLSGSRDRTIRIWDPRIGVQLQVIELVSMVTSMKIMGDICYTACRESAARDFNIFSVNVRTGKIGLCFEGHQGKIKSYIIEGSTMVTCSTDNTVRQWDLKSGACVAIFRGHYAPVNAIAMVGTKYLFSGSSDGNIRVWLVSKGGKRLASSEPRVSRRSCLSNNRRTCSFGGSSRMAVTRQQTSFSSLGAISTTYVSGDSDQDLYSDDEDEDDQKTKIDLTAYEKEHKKIALLQSRCKGFLTRKRYQEAMQHSRTAPKKKTAPF